jgi:(1->4)-alpha-D-glucan 1-alpha-D-glucosylmutase
MTTPRATYRLQFRGGMDFDRAAELVPYLRSLGISHLYASPIFTAVTGSTHGYDVTDHNEIDPAIGGRDGFDRLSSALKQAGMGLILDIVPNHMAASLENPWWRDVIEWGSQSVYRDHFDIDWSERLTLPILGRPYSEISGDGELSVQLDRQHGGLVLAYFDNRLPIAPATYREVLAKAASPLAAALLDISTSARPQESQGFHDAVKSRLGDDRAVADLAAELARLSADHAFVDAVHAAQPWQLIFWKEARRHLSYRRFFEVTGLVGVRVEDPPVFEDVHRLALELVRSGHVDGLRVDHVDGLADPKAYLNLLRREAGPDIFLVVEKILGRGETLPADWPIDGTTGYEFIGAMAGLLVDQDGATEMGTLYAANARHADIAEETLAAKRLMASRNFETELSVLLELAGGLHQAMTDGPPTAEAVKTALVEFIAAFPVYRTYGTDEGMPSRDREMLMRVAETVRRSNRQVDDRLLNSVLRILTGDVPPALADKARRFTKRFQQLTGPVTAKAVEDTVFYRCNSLIALNEVGCDPSAKGVAVQDIHRLFATPANFPPGGLLATATHDTKRGEDARARLYALSEAPSVWADAVSRWRGMHTSLVEPLAGGPAPEPDTEWLLYQALAGVWPAGAKRLDAAELAALSQRFEAYVEKALREAKVRTDWADTDEAYEAAVKAYAARLLSPDNAGFLDDFMATLQPFIEAGALNSLAQTLIKMTAPGVPDFYQGVEGGDFSLVDPDNRQPVDFAALARCLEAGWLTTRFSGPTVCRSLGQAGRDREMPGFPRATAGAVCPRRLPCAGRGRRQAGPCLRFSQATRRRRGDHRRATSDVSTVDDRIGLVRPGILGQHDDPVAGRPGPVGSHGCLDRRQAQ